jgi:hypothetical protein
MFFLLLNLASDDSCTFCMLTLIPVQPLPFLPRSAQAIQQSLLRMWTNVIFIIKNVYSNTSLQAVSLSTVSVPCHQPGMSWLNGLMSFLLTHIRTCSSKHNQGHFFISQNVYWMLDVATNSHLTVYHNATVISIISSHQVGTGSSHITVRKKGWV